MASMLTLSGLQHTMFNIFLPYTVISVHNTSVVHSTDCHEPIQCSLLFASVGSLKLHHNILANKGVCVKTNFNLYILQQKLVQVNFPSKNIV